jgi:hypothetical protein
MSLICAFTVPCAAVPCSNFPIQGACINKLRHRRLQKFPILYISSKNFLQGVQSLNLSTLSSEGAHFAQIKKGEKRAKQDALFFLKNKFLSNNETEIHWSSCSRKTIHVQLCRTSLGNVFFQSRAQCGLFSAISAIVSSKETNLGWDVFMRGSGTYKEKERQKAVLSGTMVVGLAVNCGMLPWLFKEHLPVHLSQSVYSGQASRHIQHLPYL